MWICCCLGLGKVNDLSQTATDIYIFSVIIIKHTHTHTQTPITQNENVCFVLGKGRDFPQNEKIPIKIVE